MTFRASVVYHHHHICKLHELFRMRDLAKHLLIMYTRKIIVHRACVRSQIFHFKYRQPTFRLTSSVKVFKSIHMWNGYVCLGICTHDLVVRSQCRPAICTVCACPIRSEVMHFLSCVFTSAFRSLCTELYERTGLAWSGIFFFAVPIILSSWRSDV